MVCTCGDCSGMGYWRLEKLKFRLKIVKWADTQYNTIQTALVTIISYKPLSGLKFSWDTRPGLTASCSTVLYKFKPVVTNFCNNCWYIVHPGFYYF